MTIVLRLLAPRYRVASIAQLTPGRLHAWGLEALMLDLDNTLVAWGESTPPPVVHDWLAELRRSRIAACVVSNSYSARTRAISTSLGLPAAQGRSKPSSRKLRDALRILGSPPERTAMVGDQLFTDVLAGNRLGVPTILTAPLAPNEPFRVWMMRGIERRVFAVLARRGLMPPTPEV